MIDGEGGVREAGCWKGRGGGRGVAEAREGVGAAAGKGGGKTVKIFSNRLLCILTGINCRYSRYFINYGSPF